jgi:hypothetical protein
VNAPDVMTTISSAATPAAALVQSTATIDVHASRRRATAVRLRILRSPVSLLE